MSGWGAVWLVARREIVTRLRSRAYRLSTAALVLIVIGGTFATQSLPDLFQDDPRRLGLAPEAADLRGALAEGAALFEVDMVLVDVAGGVPADEAIRVHDLDALLLAPDRVVFESSVDGTLQAIVSRAAYEAALPERAAALGLTVEEARSLTQPAPLTVEVDTPPSASEDDLAERYGLASFSTIVLLMAMSFYGQWVLVGVIEEKSNRVVEVLLAVVAPWQLLTGKVLGIMALAVFQILVTLTAIVAALLFVEGVTLPEAGAASIAMSATWLVLGLLLYNFVYAAVGSTASRPEDASSAVLPVLTPLMAGYFAALIYVPQNPDTIISAALSIFPLTAPLVMPARFVAGDVALVEVAAAMVSTVLGIAAVIWLGSRIYQGAILQTQRVSILAAFRRARE